MKPPLLSKNIIVTGASRGLGQAISRAMWEAGASLLITARSGEALDALARDLRNIGRPDQTIHTITVDLASSESVDLIISKARSVWDTLWGLVNNAAVLGPVGKVWANDPDDWQRTLSINLTAPVFLCRQCVPWMERSGQGKIINLSGGGATGPRPHFSAYAIAKTGIVRFTEILAHEVREMNIQVNAVAPGAMNTNMLTELLNAGPEKAGAQEYQKSRKQQEEGGVDPEVAARLCVFLASGESDGITGRLISAVWDDWETLPEYAEALNRSDVYTLRRIIPKERGFVWGEK